jgi:hypothetical protein
MQESFRARLTPKPWRLDVGQPPVKFPFETPDAEGRYRDWERTYESKAAGYATCAFRTSFNPNSIQGLRNRCVERASY